MNSLGLSPKSAAARLMLAAGVLATAAAPADAVLTNKYTFNNGTAEDSVGGQHGTLIDNTGIARYTGGALNLSANNGAGSNQDFSSATTVGAFVDLPDGVFHAAANSTGQVTLEMWLTVDQNRNWAEAFVFGRTANEGAATGGEGQNYIALIPQSGPGDFRATTRSNATGNPEVPLIGQATPLATQQRHHVVLTLNAFDNSAGGVNGTATLYLNNGAPVTAAIQPGLDLIDNTDQSNNWIGRSLFPDPLFDGLIDEFRIYNHVLTSTEVASSFATGPDPAPLPVLVVNRDTGAISLANQSNSGITIKGYSITSAGGALNSATWTSIDAGNVFDSNGTWTSQSSTSTNLAESVTGGVLDGGELAPNTSRAIGTPWRKTAVQDVEFSFTLGDGTVASGQIQYTGSAAIRSDFNGDGLVNASDWALFVPNTFTTFASELAVGAYLKGDLDGDKDNDYADFKIFKADFIAANGEAAFAALGAAVPEPAALTLACAAGLTLAAARRRKA